MRSKCWAVFVFLGFIYFNSCQADLETQHQEITSDVSTAIDSLYSSIEIENEVVTFDTIVEETIVQGTFYLKSTGTRPATIESVRCSFGCTVDRFPRSPMAPSSRDSIIVRFNSKMKPYHQNKKIFVALEGKEDLITLIFSGYVTPIANEYK